MGLTWRPRAKISSASVIPRHMGLIWASVSTPQWPNTQSNKRRGLIFPVYAATRNQYKQIGTFTLQCNCLPLRILSISSTFYPVHRPNSVFTERKKKKKTTAEKEYSLYNTQDSNTSFECLCLLLIIQVLLSFTHALWYIMSVSRQLQNQPVNA